MLMKKPFLLRLMLGFGALSMASFYGAADDSRPVKRVRFANPTSMGQKPEDPYGTWIDLGYINPVARKSVCQKFNDLVARIFKRLDS